MDGDRTAEREGKKMHAKGGSCTVQSAVQLCGDLAVILVMVYVTSLVLRLCAA